MKLTLTILFCATFIAKEVYGHGYLIEPVGRSSRWRKDRSAPVNYNDNQLFCGGFHNQYDVNNGKCGVCGDPYQDPKPRANEHGGKYGNGVIVRTYMTGDEIPIQIELTANHFGHFEFHLCNLDDSLETDDCFSKHPLNLTDGTSYYPIDTRREGLYDMVLKLPSTLTCNHCVLQWHYHAGNNWGVCPNGKGEIGCGDQETFRSCADIKIGPKSALIVEEVENAPIEVHV